MYEVDDQITKEIEQMFLLLFGKIGYIIVGKQF